MATDLREQLQDTLGNLYTLERELGGGGMSRVFVADEKRLGRKVVVKVLSPELAAGVSAERFEREIRVAASLQQANIVPVLAAGESNGMPYFTMPFVEGESLRKRLAEGRTLSLQETMRVLGDVARALTYAHEHGVVHRDIKPDNVLLSGGTAVVTDFGIAKAISAARTASEAATLTQLGTSLGTPAYMSPEQAAGDPDVDHRADIYAFGCMAFELLTGRPPFQAKSPQRVLAAQMGEAPPQISELNPQTPPLLADLVMRCLAKLAEERPASAAELTVVLDSVTSGGGLPAMPPVLLGGPVMLRRALLVYVGAFAVVVLAAQAAITALGLPDWVLPGAAVVMLLGLPAILLTAYTQRATFRALTATPTRTPGGSPKGQGALATLAVKASPLVSWRRTTLGGVVALSVFALGVAAFMVLRALGIGPAGSLISAGKLDSREPLLVADFQTSAADTALSRVLAEAMRTNLGESRVISLVEPGVIAAGLQRMLVPVDTLLDADLARNLAQREGIKAVVAGTVSPLSAGYVISARLVAAQSGEDLARVQETVDGAGDLIAATDRLSRKLRERIGESLKHVRADPPLAQVTTNSLEALRKYAEGVRANDVEFAFGKSVRLLEEAIALDSNFGMAYRKLGIAMGNLGNVDPARRREVFDKAYQLRDRMTERERLLATAGYHSGGPHADRAKTIEAYEALLQKYPDEGAALLNLALAYQGRRQFARAESLYLRRIELDSTVQFAPFNIISAQLSQGKVEAARASLERAARLFPGHPRIAQGHVVTLYASGDLDSLAAYITRNTPDSGIGRQPMMVTLARLRRREGKLAAARALVARARPATPANRLSDSAEAAQEELWFFDRPAELVRRLDAALRQIPLKSLPQQARAEWWIASLYAAAGRTDRARAILDQHDADLADSVARRLAAPDRQFAQAWIALAEGRYREAIDLFRASDRLPDGPRGACRICLDPALGRAFDLAEMPDSAIAVYEHFVDTPEAFRGDVDSWELARIVRRLGELYEAKGDRAKAAAYYQRFVDMWKEADPALQPRVAEIRQRLLRLRDIEGR